MQILTTYLSTFARFIMLKSRPIACTLVMSKLFGSVNYVVFHNKSRQYDLAL